MSVSIRYLQPSAAGCSNLDAIHEMEAYLSQVPEDLSLKPIIGTDCASPLQSRLKVYVWSPRTSFSSPVTS
jgi:hypothetical protein